MREMKKRKKNSDKKDALCRNRRDKEIGLWDCCRPDHVETEESILSKRFLLSWLAIITFVCTGCFGGHIGLSIDESGEVHSKVTMVGVEFMRDELERQKQEYLKGHPNAIVTPAQDGNMSGYSIQLDYKDMDSFAADGVKFYVTRPGICKGIQKTGRWFFDAYGLDLYIEGNKELSQDKEAVAMAQALLSQVRFDFTLNLPYEADSHNAESVSNKNKTLSWNLAPTLTRGESRKIHATFKIWNKLNIGLTIGLAVLLLAGAIIFAIQAAAAEGDEKRTKAGFSLGIGCALLVTGLGSAYLLFAPVRFTDSDIISVTWQEESKQDTTQQNTTASPQAGTPALKPAQVPEQQSRRNTPKPPAQQNRQNAVPAPRQSKHDITSDLTLANVAIGDSFSKVQQVLGTPYKEETKSGGIKHYFYPSVEIHCQNGTVITLISNSREAATSRGVHEGSSLQDVLSAYGKDYMKSRYDNLDLYEYNFKARNGLSKVLRFAVDSRNRVDYISIR